METLVLFGLVIASIVALVSAGRARERLDRLDEAVGGQKDTISRLETAIRKLQADLSSSRPRVASPSVPVVPTPIRPFEKPVAPVAPPAIPIVVPTAAKVEPASPPEPVDLPVERPATAPVAATTPAAVPPPIAPPIEEPAPAAPRVPSFDWESLIGVRLSAAVAGIALLVAAVFFLLYSVEHGWLQPNVRVAIGVLTGITLLVVCERKAARVYPVTANALDASAIAILFSTFFAAHALWNLVPATATFFLLALVTAVAVLLSIRRDSLFIAVLGLLGGFMTPALLSTGANQPVGLFLYLLLLNIGLTWVAYRKRWPVLTVLSAVLTTIYQWGWVLKFLHESPLSLAMGIFLVFPAAAMVGVMIGNRRRVEPDSAHPVFEQTGLVFAALPLVFSVYLAAIPAYGTQPGLLFGFLLIVDAGLLAVSIARSEERLHLIGGAATLLVAGLWLGAAYTASAWTTVLVCFALFVLLYVAAPAIARRVGRPLGTAGAQASYAAPLLLFAFAMLAQQNRAAASPVSLFGTLFALAVLIAWRAIAERTGGLYFVAAFFVLAAEATWSSAHLVTESLGTAVGLYAAFGLFALGVPIAARRAGRPLEPAHGAGIVLLASLGLLLFLALSPVAPAAIWGLAILLAILNAALFIESASGRMPVVSIVGGVLSWVVLAAWWARAAAIVGLLPSLLVVVLLSLVMLAGYAWSHAQATKAQRASLEDESGSASAAGFVPRVRFRDGLFLGLGGHFFLCFVAANPAWSVPPWPLFGAAAVLTLAVSVVALLTRVGELQAAGLAAASVVVAVWAGTAEAAPWPLVALIAAAAASAFGLGTERSPSVGAAIALFVGEVTAIVVSVQPGAPSVVWLATAHTANLVAILALAWRCRWPWVAPAAIAPAWLAVATYQALHHEPASWAALLAFSSVLYLVFVSYPFVLGRRARATRDPYLAGVLSSGFFLFAAREAFERGGLSAYVGVVPVAEGAVMALLLRQILRLEADGSHDVDRLVVVAGAALALITVAIPLQLDEQWITIGWALEGAALAWLCSRIPHPGLFYLTTGLLGTVFVRLALNPAVFTYEPRGALRIFNWYLYSYVLCAAAHIIAATWLTRTRFGQAARFSVPALLHAGAAVLLFLLLNIEIADFYSTGPDIMFRFGVTLAQDLTYTIGWLIFGLALLATGIAVHSRPARIAALALIAITTFKCFLFDLSRLGGLYRVASFVGLAASLALVSILLQKYVLAPKSKVSP